MSCVSPSPSLRAPRLGFASPFLAALVAMIWGLGLSLGGCGGDTKTSLPGGDNEEAPGDLPDTIGDDPEEGTNPDDETADVESPEDGDADEIATDTPADEEGDTSSDTPADTPADADETPEAADETPADLDRTERENTEYQLHGYAYKVDFFEWVLPQIDLVLPGQGGQSFRITNDALNQQLNQAILSGQFTLLMAPETEIVTQYSYRMALGQGGKNADDSYWIDPAAVDFTCNADPERADPKFFKSDTQDVDIPIPGQFGGGSATDLPLRDLTVWGEYISENNHDAGRVIGRMGGLIRREDAPGIVLVDTPQFRLTMADVMRLGAPNAPVVRDREGKEAWAFVFNYEAVRVTLRDRSAGGDTDTVEGETSDQEPIEEIEYDLQDFAFRIDQLEWRRPTIFIQQFGFTVDNAQLNQQIATQIADGRFNMLLAPESADLAAYPYRVALGTGEGSASAGYTITTTNVNYTAIAGEGETMAFSSQPTFARIPLPVGQGAGASLPLRDFVVSGTYAADGSAIANGRMTGLIRVEDAPGIPLISAGGFTLTMAQVMQFGAPNEPTVQDSEGKDAWAFVFDFTAVRVDLR